MCIMWIVTSNDYFILITHSLPDCYVWFHLSRGHFAQDITKSQEKNKYFRTLDALFLQGDTNTAFPASWHNFSWKMSLKSSHV